MAAGSKEAEPKLQATSAYLLPRAAKSEDGQGLSPLSPKMLAVSQPFEIRQPGNKQSKMFAVFYCTCWLTNTTFVSLLLCCGLLPLLSRYCCR